MDRAKSERQKEMLKCSYLTKAPPGEGFTLRQWRRRWFVLLDSVIVFPMAPRSVRLEYYENEVAANNMGEPKGIVDLTECSAVRKSDRAVKGHKYVFSVVTNHREYFLSADSAAERNAWVEVLHAVTADDFKAREYREYLRLSKVYNVDPGPAAGPAPVATHGMTTSTSFQGTEQLRSPGGDMRRPQSVACLHSPQLNTGRPMGEITVSTDKSPSFEPDRVYAAVNRVPQENLGRLPKKRQSAPEIRQPFDANPPPVPMKRDESFLEEEEPEEEQMAAFMASSKEKRLTIPQNGGEISALQPRRFGDSGSHAEPEEIRTHTYQNLASASLDDEETEDSEITAGAYDHVVHQPSVRHKNQAIVKQLAEDFGVTGTIGYSEVAETDEIRDPAGYSRVVHTHARSLGPYEEVPDSRAKSTGARPVPEKGKLKRVSSLDMKKHLGVNRVAMDTQIRAATVDVADVHDDSSGEFDHLQPSPRSPPRAMPRLSPRTSREASPRQSRSPSPTRRKPIPSPKPQMLVAPDDTYDHLTPPSSPRLDRRAQSGPITANFPVALPGLAGGPLPPRLSPAVGGRRVSSPCILEDGDQRRFASGSSPRRPPRTMDFGRANSAANSMGVQRRSVPDLHLNDEVVESFYDVPDS